LLTLKLPFFIPGLRTHRSYIDVQYYPSVIFCGDAAEAAGDALNLLISSALLNIVHSCMSREKIYCFSAQKQQLDITLVSLSSLSFIMA
jgi:hypothetical protein